MTPQLRSRRWLTAQIKKRRMGSAHQTYKEICRELEIYDPHGCLAPGLAMQLERGYEPKRKETRDRLRLLPLQSCPSCHRKIVKRAHRAQIPGLTPRQRRIWRKADPETKAAIIKKGLRR